jgi:hypothetical protein
VPNTYVDAWRVGDLRKARINKHATLILPTPDTLQCIAFREDGAIYSSQGYPPSPGSAIEDSYYSLHVNGVRQSTMKVVGGGHGTLFAVHPDGDLLINWSGRGLVKLPYVSGTPSPSAGQVWGAPFATHGTSASVDHDHGNVLLYGGTKATVYRIADVEAGVGEPLYPTVNLPVDARLRQGWCTYGDELFYLVGRPTRDQAIDVYDLNTGTIKYTRDARLVSTSTAYFQEPEGIVVRDGVVCVGFTTKTSSTAASYTHVVMAMIGFGARFRSDEGWHFVDPVKVDTQLQGRNSAGEVTTQRAPDYPLWIRSLKPRPAADQDTVGEQLAYTEYGTAYAANYLKRGLPV